jgi:two-component system, cell cycle sensor histidine kinase and response regulator CckA
MKMRTKLLGAFGLLALVILGISFTGYWEANNLSSLYEAGIASLQDVKKVQAVMVVSSGIGILCAFLVVLLVGRMITRPLERAEAALRLSEERFSKAFNMSPFRMGIFRQRDSVILDVNDRWVKDLGFAREEVVGRSVFDMTEAVGEEEHPKLRKVHREGKPVRDVEVISRTKTGEKRFSLYSLEVIELSGETCFLWATNDITERKRSEEALRESEALFRATFENATVGVFLTDTHGKLLKVNETFCNLLGYGREELEGKSIGDFAYRPDKDIGADYVAQAIAGQGSSLHFEKRYLHRDGRLVWVYLSTALLFDSSGRPQYFITHVQDITERKRSEEALRESEAKFRAIFENSGNGMAVVSLEGHPVECNRALVKILGYSEEQLRGMAFTDYTHVDDRELDWRLYGELIAGKLDKYEIDKRFIRSDGQTIWGSLIVSLVSDSAGRPKYGVGIVQDITERKKSENALRDSEERFRQLVENIQEVFWITDVQKNQMLYISPGYQKVWGRSPESLFESPRSWLDAIHPEDQERVRQAALKQAWGGYVEEYRIVRPNGSMRWIRDSAVPIPDTSGQIYRVVGIAEDITERRHIEEQLRQAQKMEAIGLLAGGVAHDFNNLLTAIIGYSQLAEFRLEEGDPLRFFVEEIRQSGERAAALTRQLLAFSRRQVMQPRELDLNESVSILAKMLQRILGEDIRMQLKLGPSPLLIEADPGMIDQILMNLAVNARDAMPGGGTLMIETAARIVTDEESLTIPESTPGQYVCLTVHDTGCGIAPENIDRIFEPFFTTKELGKGTGLGLATVFGIVKQHQGAILVSSQVDYGTIFEILLPAIVSDGHAAVAETSVVAPRGGSETVLLVEDELAVCKLMGILLRQYGYEVLEAHNGIEAVRVWEQNEGHVDLLLTDLVMPEGVNGRDLAAQLQARDPSLKVIFTSGYSADLADQSVSLHGGQILLQKPCPPVKILDAVRHCLES